MSTANKAPEQSESMEDILHSIRRIIANEPEAAGDLPALELDDEPLELTEVVAEPEEPFIPARAEIPEPVMSMPEPTPPPAPVVAAPAPPPPPPPPVVVSPVVEKIREDSLLTGAVAEASAHALKNLVDSIPKPKIDSPALRSGSTLEDLVVESLRPELSQWLNHNLPILVQSLVEKEIRKLLPRD